MLVLAGGSQGYEDSRALAPPVMQHEEDSDQPVTKICDHFTKTPEAESAHQLAAGVATGTPGGTKVTKPMGILC